MCLLFKTPSLVGGQDRRISAFAALAGFADRADCKVGTDRNRFATPTSSTIHFVLLIERARDNFYF